MNTTPIRRTETWLKSSSHELETILKQVQQLSILQHKITPHLDPALLPYCQVASLSLGELVLLVANGSIATQLRLQSFDLLLKLKNDPELPTIRTIECKVRPQTTSSRMQPPHHNKPALTLSNAAADAIERTAISLEDSSLKEIMFKIAKHRHR
jgi:hypothetical protein